ncbi:peptidase S8/S53 domain-containing protein [Dunaliella salina]|uniref:Peptidase S8/S53 domain-containing protein n=1 Tax=Dunaliella salina TaxID=3046 RepID=A0ABQ7GSX4_DUNSA|nr:peptidase S8/S53 domain-containing protein [Dunaliella salina]|eukprot:KAF5837681.1 peptidase S8/S53 domain-containing protein [Dunaliella salina]
MITLQGLEWVAENARYPAVVHISIGGPENDDVNEAVERLTEDFGIPVVVSAGNQARGPCVDILAPGAHIISAVSSSTTASTTKSGTGTAAPFVSGAVALYLSNHLGASVKEITQKLLQSATQVDTLRNRWSPDFGRLQLAD